MAVLIAANLRKELAGAPLFDGVAFKVERRDRLALAGPNGAGKTTLLRALSGEVSLQGGDLAGAADLAAVEAELRELEQAMASGAHDGPTIARYGRAQARLEHAGGYDWR